MRYVCYSNWCLFIHFLDISFSDAFQISEVVNSMKDLIDYSRETGTGPMGKLYIISPGFTFFMLINLRAAIDFWEGRCGFGWSSPVV